MYRISQAFKYLLIGLFTVAGLFILVGYFYLQLALRGELEAGISERLGTPVNVGLAHVGLYPPTIRLGRVAIGNPDGFSTQHLLVADELALVVERYEHKHRLIHSSSMTIDNLDVWIERQDGRSNSSVIQENQRRYDRKHALGRADKTKFIIRELRIRNINAHLSAGSSDRKQVIPELVLHDVGARGGGVTMGELAGLVADAAFRAAVRGEVKRKLEEYKQDKKRELGRKLQEMFE